MNVSKAITFPIKVLPDDIDFMGHVNNARYLNWVQDTVLAHWQKLAPAEEWQQGLGRAQARDYLSPPGLSR